MESDAYNAAEARRQAEADQVTADFDVLRRAVDDEAAAAMLVVALELRRARLMCVEAMD